MNNKTTALAKVADEKEAAALAARFNRFRNANVMGVRRYIEAGKHVLLIRRCEQGPTTNTEKKKKDETLEKTVVEFKVIATELLEGYEVIEANDEQFPKKKGFAVGPLGREIGEKAVFQPMQVGEICSMAEVSSSQGYDGNVLVFVAGVLGMTIDELNADESFTTIFQGIFTTAQVFHDMLVVCTAQQVRTTSKDAKSPVYTAKTWEPVHAADYAQYGLEAPEGAYGAELPVEGDGDSAAAVDAAAAEAAEA